MPSQARTRLRRIGVRLGSFLASLVVASFIVFALINLLPGDVAGVILGPDATADAIETMRVQLGLDRPWLVRYLDWLASFWTGDFGVSAYSGRPVTGEILAKLAITGWLVIIGMVLALLIALPLGMYSAMRRGKPDGIITAVLSQIGMSIPAFVVGIALSLIVGVKLRWLPANEYVPISQSFIGWLRHIILPALTLALVQSAILVRYVRSAFIDVLHQDYYRTARSIGWRRWPALIRHGIRNASLQIITVVGLQLATQFVGAIVVESVFVLGGLGQYLLSMVANRDLPVVQSVVMLLVTMVLVINLLVDIAYTLIDPRLKTRTNQEGERR